MQLSDVRPSAFFFIRMIMRGDFTERYLMELLAFLQHRDQPGDSLPTSLRFLCRLNAPDDGVAVDAVEAGEEFLRFWIVVQLGFEVRRHRRSRRRIVGGLPAAISFGALDLGEAGGTHLTALDQPQRFFAID